MKKNIFSVFFILIFFTTYSQEKLDLERLGFSINIPKNWISTNNDAVLENLKNFAFTDAQMNDLLKSNNSSVNLATFVKYNPQGYRGIIPTIKIRTRQIKIKNLEDFLNQVNLSNEEIENTLDHFKYIDTPTFVDISGKKIIKFSVQFDLKTSNDFFTISSRSYYIPKDGYYISLNFIEEIEKEDNSLLFEELIKTISLTDK